VGKIPRGIF
jgi:hypothetical protein